MRANLYVGLPPSNSRILVPLAVPRVQFLSFDLYGPESLRGKLFKRFGQFFARTGLMMALGKFVASPVETFKTPETVGPILRTDIIDELQRTWEDALGKGPLSIAFSLGTPNFYQKITGLLFDLRAEPVAVVKVGFTPQARSLISNERRALQTMRSLRLKSVVAPDLLESGDTGPTAWVLQSVFLNGGSSSVTLQKEHHEFVAELSLSTRETMSLASWDVYRWLRDRLNGPVLPIKAEFESDRSFITDLCRRLQTLDYEYILRPWLFGSIHGDYAPWNMRLSNARIELFDWEYFLPLAPVGWDLLYFVVRVENLIRKKSLQNIYNDFESGVYKNVLATFENRISEQIPNHQFLIVLVILAVALDLIPKWICRETVF